MKKNISIGEVEMYGKAMLRIAGAVVLLLALLFACTEGGADFLSGGAGMKGKLVGGWTSGGEDLLGIKFGQDMLFNADGTFVMKAAGFIAKGKWAVVGSEIVLTQGKARAEGLSALAYGEGEISFPNSTMKVIFVDGNTMKGMMDGGEYLVYTRSDEVAKELTY